MVAETGATRWGYQITATDVSGNGSGAFSNPDNNSQIQVNGGREFVSHLLGGTFDGVANGPVTWTVDWTAPLAGAGTVYFWQSGLACDFDLTEFGDNTYTFARASAEGGIPSADATIMTQHDYPISGNNTISRSAGVDLAADMRVSNHLPGAGTTQIGRAHV